MPTTMSDVQDFLAQKRIALVGVSRNEKDLSRMLFREMCSRGYDMVPVNPAAGDVENKRCFAHVQEIQPPPDAVLIMTRAGDTERVVRDCAEAGVRRLWMHRAGGQGSVSPEAVEFCHNNGIRLVEGYCPFMFLSHAGFVHQFHRLVVRCFGNYPAARAS